MSKNLEKYYNTSDNTDTETISAFRFRLYWLFRCLCFTTLEWQCDFRPNNLEFHLGCHTCRLRYFTLVCLWWGQTIGCSVGRCTVTWLPNFLGRVELLSYGAPQACVSRARRAPLRTELIYTFRVGLNFGESILNIQVATTALLQVSLYFSDAQITKFSYPQCTVHRSARESFAKNVCGEPRRSKRQNRFMSRGSHFVSGDLKSFVYAQLAS